MVAIGSGKGQCIEVRGVDFSKSPVKFEARVEGKGEIEVRQNNVKGDIIATLKFDSKKMEIASTKIQKKISGTHTLCFVFGEGDFRFDEWKCAN